MTSFAYLNISGSLADQTLSYLLMKEQYYNNQNPCICKKKNHKNLNFQFWMFVNKDFKAWFDTKSTLQPSLLLSHRKKIDSVENAAEVINKIHVYLWEPM